MAHQDPKHKLHQPTAKPSLILLINVLIVIHAQCSAVMINCSRPDPISLLEALAPVLNLSAIRPVMNLSTPTYVRVFFTLYGILGVDEKAQVLTTYLWQNYKWKSEFFSWDPEQCGTKHISLPRKKVWVPDVVINEFMDDNSAPHVPYVSLFHDGTVHDAFPMRVVSSCNLNIYTFPFDIQNCSLTFNSYVHYVTDIRLELGKPVQKILERSKEVMTTMGEWQLLNVTTHQYILETADGDKLDELAFHITVMRRPTLYVVNLLIPSCFLITVDLFSFLLPPQSVDRSAFKMTLILGYTVFLLMMNDMLPVTGNAIPLINVFFSICLALMVASLLETILITNLLSGSAASQLPRWIEVLFLHILGRLVGLPPKPREKGDSEKTGRPLVAVDSKADEKTPGKKGPEVEDKALGELRRLGCDLQAIRFQIDQHLTDSQGSEEWIQVGFIIDRLLFALYVIFIVVSFITIVCIWAKSYNP